MDISSMIQNLNTDYTSKITNAMNTNATSGVAAVDGSDSDSTFDSIYSNAVSLLDSTNQYIQDAQQAEVDFALGNITSTHELGVIQQKANLALSYTVAIRDKVLDAYKEIMNMQI